MKITLDTPYSVGDLAPDVTYPHVYITTFYVNGPGKTVVITYEVGELRDLSAENPMGTWVKAQEVGAQSLQLSGDQLYPFFSKQVNTDAGVTPLLWDQVETLLYQLVQNDQPRFAGTLQ